MPSPDWNFDYDYSGVLLRCYLLLDFNSSFESDQLFNLFPVIMTISISSQRMKGINLSQHIIDDLRSCLSVFPRH
jgi:hypothetical protein